MPPRELKDIWYDADAHDRIDQAFQLVHKVAKAAYGPKAGNVLLGNSYSAPTLSRDGVTNLQKLSHYDRAIDDVIKVIVQSSQENNKRVGDGTTCAAILAAHLYWDARKLVAAGHNRMQVARQIREAGVEAIEYIDSVKKPVTKKLLKHVASISSGDEAIGDMIADVIGAMGLDGSVQVENFPGLGIHSELVAGFYFDRGFANANLINDFTNLKAIYEKAYILITEKPLRTANEIAGILQRVTEKGIKELVIIGEIGDEAMATLLLNKIRAVQGKGGISTTAVDVPYFAGARSLFLEDIAVLTDGVVYNGGSKQDFDPERMLGRAERVIIDEFSTTIVGGDGDKATVRQRVAQLREQLRNAPNPDSQAAIKNRLGKLTGKIAIIRVGGATETEQKEVRLRVDDAVSATQAALRDGIVPGGGVILARVGTQFSDAFKQPFCELVDNAGLNVQEALWHMLEGDTWCGYNLRITTPDELSIPIDLLKAGVIDPALVVKEVVRNATSVAADLITASTLISFRNEEPKK